MVETVVKANGSREPYSRQKLLLSIVRCGLPEQDALRLAEELEESLPAVVTSDEIHSRLLARLRERYPRCAVSDAKVALYVYARYLDLKDQFDRA